MKERSSSNRKSFWGYVSQQAKMTEIERLASIKNGLPYNLLIATQVALDLNLTDFAKILNTSRSSLKRHELPIAPLNPIISERLDRIAQIAGIALEIMESRQETIGWLTRPHAALNNAIPVSLCDTEIGGRQVRRILTSIEWGGSA